MRSPQFRYSVEFSEKEKDTVFLQAAKQIGKWAAFGALAVPVVYGAVQGIEYLYELGYWHRGVQGDIEKHDLLKQVDTLSSEKAKLEEELGRSRASVDQLSKYAQEGDQQKTLLSQVQEEKVNLERKNGELERKIKELTDTNKKLQETSSDLKKQIDDKGRRSALLSQIEALGKERNNLEGRVQAGLDKLSELRGVEGSSREQYRFCSYGFRIEEEAKCPPDLRVRSCSDASVYGSLAADKEKETEWLKDRFKTIGEEISRLQSQL